MLTAMGRDGHVSAARARASHLARTNLRIATWISVLRRPLYTSSLYLTATSLAEALTVTATILWFGGQRVGALLVTLEMTGALVS